MNSEDYLNFTPSDSFSGNDSTEITISDDISSITSEDDDYVVSSEDQLNENEILPFNLNNITPKILDDNNTEENTYRDLYYNKLN